MQSRVVYEDGSYTVCSTRAGLTVQHKQTGKGTLLTSNTEHWIEALDTAIDTAESRKLCSFLYNAL